MQREIQETLQRIPGCKTIQWRLLLIADRSAVDDGEFKMNGHSMEPSAMVLFSQWEEQIRDGQRVLCLFVRQRIDKHGQNPKYIMSCYLAGQNILQKAPPEYMQRWNEHDSTTGVYIGPEEGVEYA